MKLGTISTVKQNHVANANVDQACDGMGNIAGGLYFHTAWCYSYNKMVEYHPTSHRDTSYCNSISRPIKPISALKTMLHLIPGSDKDPLFRALTNTLILLKYIHVLMQISLNIPFKILKPEIFL